MRKSTPDEPKTLRKILLVHDAKSLSPYYPDHSKLNIMLDHLRGMLIDIGDGDL